MLHSNIQLEKKDERNGELGSICTVATVVIIAAAAAAALAIKMLKYSTNSGTLISSKI